MEKRRARMVYGPVERYVTGSRWRRRSACPVWFFVQAADPYRIDRVAAHRDDRVRPVQLSTE